MINHWLRFGECIYPVDFIVRGTDRGYLPVIVVYDPSGETEVYRGEFHPTPAEALTRAIAIWDTDGTPEIIRLKKEAADFQF